MMMMSADVVWVCSFACNPVRSNSAMKEIVDEMSKNHSHIIFIVKLYDV